MAYTTIDKPSDYFETILYSGNGSTQSITSLDFQPDWCWLKARAGDNVSNNRSVDSVRGATKELFQDATAAEETNTNGLTAFNSNGFSLGSSGGTNNSNTTYASWNWKETATAGFDIVAYTGNATVRTISHSLSAVPKMIIVKNRSNIHDWRVYHASLGATHDIYLSSNGAKVDSTTPWNDTEPTSSVFTVGTANGTNQNGDSLIAYLFAEKKGYSKFGSYTGNGNADGTFIYTGFKPAFIMCKRTDGADDWFLLDNKRDIDNPANHWLMADSSGAEQTSPIFFDFLSNGFKNRGTGGGNNASGGTYIYMAFAENPFVTSTGVPATAR
ncbi:hypothetical protein N9Y58_01350 [Alphaproteobacteria bacterium]|nr:hypothetical protein [Alphaproteobacteria bacterium]